MLLESDMPAKIAETVFVAGDAEGRILSGGTGARQRRIARASKGGI